MSSISSCPKCGQQVSVPPFAAPSAQVRCPLCSAQYSLQSALANLPPMLVLVEAAEVVSDDEDIFARSAPAARVAQPLVDSHAAAEPAALDDIDLGASDVASDDAASDDAGSALDEIEFAAPAASREELDDLAAQFASGESDIENATPAFNVDDAFDDLEADFGAADSNTRSDGTLDLSQGAFGGMSDEAADAELELETELEEFSTESADFQTEDVPRNEPDFAAKGAKAAASPELKVMPRKKRREPSMIGNLIGVVGGGAIGLGMGYMILLWAGGPKFDALKLGPMLPGWMLPAEFSRNNVLKPSLVANSGVQPQAGAATDTDTMSGDVDPDADPLPTNVPALPDDDASPDDPAAKGGIGDEDPLAIPDLPTDDPTAAVVPKVVPNTTKKPVIPADDPTDEATDEMPADDVVPADGIPADDATQADEMPADDGATDDAPPAPGETETADDEMPASDDVADAADKTNDAATDTATTDDVPADDVPAAEEKPGLRQAPSLTLVELGKAATDVSAVIKKLADPATAADKDAFKKAREQYYRKLSHLGYVLTATPDVPGLGDLRGTIEQVVSESTVDEKKFSEIGRAAGKWITMPLAKRGDQGIIVAGTVESVEPAGRLFETKVTLPGGQQILRLLSDTQPTVSAADRVVVLGSIVETPSQDLVGYDGADEAVVWTGMAVALPKSE